MLWPASRGAKGGKDGGGDGDGDGGGGCDGGDGGGAEQNETVPWLSVKLLGQTQTVPPRTNKFFPEFPLMVHNEMATVPPATKTPPPQYAKFPLMVHDKMVTEPPAT